MRTLILILCTLFLGCNGEEIPSSPTPLMLYLVDDFSGTRAGGQFLEYKDIKEMTSWMYQSEIPVVLIASHVSQKNPYPISLELRRFSGKLDKFEMDYKKQYAAFRQIDSTNQKEVKRFLENFKIHFIKFRKELASKYDYSYCNRHLQKVLDFLSDTTVFAHKIAVISTDFWDHQKGKDAKMVSKSLIKQLNKALQSNINARLYIITETNRQRPPLANLKANYISSWAELKTILHYHSLKKQSYAIQNQGG